MGRASTTPKLLISLLRLYPSEYRKEYEFEMAYTIRAMLDEAASGSERRKIVARLCKDYARSLIRQNILALEKKTYTRPHYIKQSSFYAVLLLLPYIIVCTFNILDTVFLHRGTLLHDWEARTWVIYCIFLPMIAFILVTIAAAARIYKAIKSGGQLNLISDFSYDALVLGVPLTLITTIVLL